MSVRSFIKEHAVGLAALILPLSDFVLRCPRGFSGWAATWYALDYSLGTGSRLLVGSLLRLLDGNFVTTASAVKLVSVACLATVLMFALVADRLYRAAPKGTKRGAGLMILLLSSAPFSLRYLWDEANFGRLDLFLVLLMLTGLFFCLLIQKPWLRAAVVAAVSILALFVHQIYFFIFFPVLFAQLLTDAFCGERVTLRRLLPAMAAGLIVTAGFVYLQLFSTINATSAEELTAALALTSDLDVSHSALDYEYFHDFLYGFEYHFLPFAKDPKSLAGLVLTLLILAPAAVLYGFLFREMFASLKERGIPAFRTPQPYGLLLLVCYLPPFLLAVDWNRWLGALFFGAALMLTALLAGGDPHAKRAFEALDQRIGSGPVLYGGLLVYFAMISPLRAREFLPEVQSLIGLLSGMF